MPHFKRRPNLTDIQILPQCKKTGYKFRARRKKARRKTAWRSASFLFLLFPFLLLLLTRVMHTIRLLLLHSLPFSWRKKREEGRGLDSTSGTCFARGGGVEEAEADLRLGGSLCAVTPPSHAIITLLAATNHGSTYHAPPKSLSLSFRRKLEIEREWLSSVVLKVIPAYTVSMERAELGDVLSATLKSIPLACSKK